MLRNLARRLADAHFVRENNRLTGLLEAAYGKVDWLTASLEGMAADLQDAEALAVRLEAERDTARRQFWDERREKVDALGRIDTLTQELTDTQAELAETIGERDDNARTIGRLNDELAALRRESMVQRGQIEDQAAQLERLGADIQRLRHTTNAAEVARLTDALKAREEQGERDRALIEELEAELGKRGAVTR